MPERSFNEIAFDIIERDPGAEPLVEEWFAVLRSTDERKHAALIDLYDAARSFELSTANTIVLGQRWQKAMGAARMVLRPRSGKWRA